MLSLDNNGAGISCPHHYFMETLHRRTNDVAILSARHLLRSQLLYVGLHVNGQHSRQQEMEAVAQMDKDEMPWLQGPPAGLASLDDRNQPATRGGSPRSC